LRFGLAEMDSTGLTGILSAIRSGVMLHFDGDRRRYDPIGLPEKLQTPDKFFEPEPQIGLDFSVLWKSQALSSLPSAKSLDFAAYSSRIAPLTHFRGGLQSKCSEFRPQFHEEDSLEYPAFP
jgi:hypothetical protein